MITIDLEDNEECIIVDDNSEEPKVEKSLKFKRRLISQVKRHRSLYDSKHKLFSNVAKKELVWQKIANNLKSDVNDCKDMWFQLRYHYQRHARKLRNYFIDGRNQNLKRPAMSLESELIFLWRFIDNRKTCNIPFEIIEEETTEAVQQKRLQSNKQRKSASNLKPLDDDIILVEPPVELIVIDEDDDANKSVKRFKLTSSMKKLIAHIKNYPELYDSQHFCFDNYIRRSSSWNVIASDLGDKATKLMKSWIVMQTRYEWEINHPKQTDDGNTVASELQVELEPLKNYIINNPNTVYKQSYYLRTAWYDPIDYFKDIYNLIVRMKKMSDIVFITDVLLKTPEKSKQYLSLWEEIATLKNASAGQCETTWLIMRAFYWELTYMRRQNYQLTDKWYFETIITELYAISKATQSAKHQQYVQQQKKVPTKKANKRAAPTSAISQGAPANKLSNPTTITTPTTTAVVTTITTTSTALKTVPPIVTLPTTNITPTTQSTSQMQLTLPKITAAISLAPQSLNSGKLQIKPIPGPPTLSPAPKTFTVTNGTVITPTPPSTEVSPPISTMSFNLPTQTKLTPITMPSLIRPLVPANTVPNVQNGSKTVPFQSGLNPRTYVKIAPCPSVTPNTIVHSVLSPQFAANLPPSPTTMPNFSASNINATVPVDSGHAIASYKMTTSVSPNLLSNNSISASTTPLETMPSTTSDNIQMPKISSAASLLSSNEILIELISSQNGNLLVVHGPPLSTKYQLPMPVVAKFIREILAIPLLHNKQCFQPSLVNFYWDHISSVFNLPVNICRACWNFLLGNFNHFPQIAPMTELMKPFETSLNVWREAYKLFEDFNELSVSKGWLQYEKIFPDVVDSISCYPVLYQDVVQQSASKNLSEMETLCAWRTISLRYPKIREVDEIWTALKSCFVQYMMDLEFGTDNKWPINWWRSLARLKFLVKAKYAQNEPLYYIVNNKMVEEIDRCVKLEMKMRNKIEPESETLLTKSDICYELPTRKQVELGALMTAIQKHPIIYGKGDIIDKRKAWQEVAKELQMEVSDCFFAFKDATKRYFAYKKQDTVSRFRINERYYKKLEEIIRAVPSGKFSVNRGKINIKTPHELNQSVELDNLPNNSDLIFPERYISDINMSNSPSELVVKNWVFALGNIPHFSESSHLKLKEILKKYLPSVASK